MDLCVLLHLFAEVFQWEREKVEWVHVSKLPKTAAPLGGDDSQVPPVVAATASELSPSSSFSRSY